MASEGQDRADALGWGRCPNRPKTFARYHTIPQKVTNVSIYDKGPEPVSHGSSDPMIEAGATSTRSLATHRGGCCARHTGGSHGRITNGYAQRGEGAMRRPRSTSTVVERGQGQYKGRSPKAPPRSVHLPPRNRTRKDRSTASSSNSFTLRLSNSSTTSSGR